MGYHYTERLFKLVRNTDSTQQLVLAVLAHRTDDRTGQCYLSIDEIAERARLHRATVIKVLDDLRPRLLTWVKRVGKDKRLSNLYTLKLPDFPKSNDVTSVVNDDQSQSPKEANLVVNDDQSQSSKEATLVANDDQSQSSKEANLVVNDDQSQSSKEANLVVNDDQSQSPTATPPVAHGDPTRRPERPYYNRTYRT